MKLFRKSVILAHRYLGIVISLMVIMWFATGITMMYVGGMPRLEPEMRLSRMTALDFSRVQLTPAQAAEKAGLENPGRASLATVMERPAYRFAGRGTTTVFADTGDVLEEINIDQSRTVASRFMKLPEDRLHFVRTLATEIDQWTLLQSRQLPLHKFAVDDADSTELYVQAETGDVAMVTTARTRMYAWVSTIPHWLYFTALRTNQPLWYRIMVWTTELAVALTVLGLVLAVIQFRKTTPFRLATSIPYRGPMRWHYITGCIFGVSTLTFAFSGLVSLEPWEWTNTNGLQVPRAAFTGGAVDLARFGAFEGDAWKQLLGGHDAKEIEFVRMQDEPYYVVRYTPKGYAPLDRERLHQPYNVTGRAEDNRLIVAASNLAVKQEPFSESSLVTRLKAAVPDSPIVASELLSDYDSYYYSRNHLTPLPVLRVKFGDPAETWVYVDPEMSQVLASINRYNRVERWLYNGLHSLDFAFWYNKRPLWDIGMIALCLGGLTSSSLGLFMGIRRMRRGARRLVSAGAGAGSPETANPGSATA